MALARLCAALALLSAVSVAGKTPDPAAMAASTGVARPQFRPDPVHLRPPPADRRSLLGRQQMNIPEVHLAPGAWAAFYLDEDRKDELGNSLLTLDRAAALDELALTFAALSPDILADSHPDTALLEENAIGTYENDPYVAFADLVDDGIPGQDDDYSTTVQYHWTDSDGTLKV